MRWVKYIGLGLLSFCLFFGLSQSRQVEASTMTVTDSGFIIYNSAPNQYRIDFILYNLQNENTDSFDYGSVIYFITKGSLQEAIDFGNLALHDFDNYINTSQNLYNITYSSNPVYIYNLPYLNTGLNPVPPEPEPVPAWYEIAWDTFSDYFTNPVPFQWFKNLIGRVFGGDNGGNHEFNISDVVDLTNPTLAPTPTPIPYSTVVIPKTDLNTGDTYYETNYIYANPSGTPVVQPYPPSNQPSGNAGGSDDNYYPVDGKPLSLPKLKWLSPVTIGDTNYDGIDSIYDGLSSVDDIGSEYTDGISAVSDATSVLPTNWLMLIGIAAAIPLLAGIISRFLS